MGLITDLLEQFTRTFSYEQLKSQRDTLPSYVDQSRLEVRCFIYWVVFKFFRTIYPTKASLRRLDAHVTSTRPSRRGKRCRTRRKPGCTKI